jgi:hypothetical protein
MIPNLAVTLICLGWFFFTMLFYKPPKPDSQAEKDIELFFKNQATPIDLKAEGVVESDGTQARTMGYLSLAYGIFILLGMLIPNSMTGRFVFLGVGGIISAVGGLLLYAAGIQDKKSQESTEFINVECEPEV